MFDVGLFTEQGPEGAAAIAVRPCLWMSAISTTSGLHFVGCAAILFPPGTKERARWGRRWLDAQRAGFAPWGAPGRTPVKRCNAFNVRRPDL